MTPQDTAKRGNMLAAKIFDGKISHEFIGDIKKIGVHHCECGKLSIETTRHEVQL